MKINQLPSVLSLITWIANEQTTNNNNNDDEFDLIMTATNIYAGFLAYQKYTICTVMVGSAEKFRMRTAKN